MLNVFKLVQDRITIKKNITEISSSAYFNKEFYLANNADVRETGQDPAVHYYHHGWKEGRNPNQYFDSHGYLRMYPDVAAIGMNPLLHYIQYGKFEGRKFAENYEFIMYKDCCILDKNKATLHDTNIKVVVLMHIYGGTLAEEISYYLSSFSKNFDIIVTTDSEKSIKKIRYYFDKINSVNVLYKIVPNKGYDTAALLIACNDIVRKYDIFCAFHNKTSPQNKVGNVWRRYLARHLFGSKDIVVNIINKFTENANLGVVFPPPFPLFALNDFWDNDCNKEGTENLLKRMGIEYSISEGDLFPVGAMFWARTKAVLPLFDMKLTYEDFSGERQKDGQLGHRIERAWGIVARNSGYEVLQVLGPLHKSPFVETLRPKRHLIYQCRSYTKADAYTLEKMFPLVDSISLISNTAIKSSDALLEKMHVVLTRENKGMDFGAWRDAIHYLGDDFLEQFDELIFCNDSCFAPLVPFEEMFFHMSHEQCDFWGNTNHGNVNGFEEHVQSYFYVFKKQVFSSSLFKLFFARMPDYTELQDLIDNAETKFTKFLMRKFSYKTYFDLTTICPCIQLYLTPLAFLLLGSPFLKKKSLNHVPGYEYDLIEYIEKLTDYPFINMLQASVGTQNKITFANWKKVNK